MSVLSRAAGCTEGRRYGPAAATAAAAGRSVSTESECRLAERAGSGPLDWS
ncbi:hypothetical protein ACFQRB_19860 [Halobaculum litoreum]|uniref:Uncharacterized protein n=1 Tax=Halobaculum litoreum TaxID=3031998 RepID=A0ABD5XSM1_9EURY